MRAASFEKRALCLWLPHWSLQRLVAKKPGLRTVPVILYEEYRQGCFRVLNCSASAFSKGVRIGMMLSEASSFCKAHLEKHDPAADLEAFQKLAVWCEQFSPAVAIQEPDCLYMDMTGLAYLFGSEQTIVTDIVKGFRKLGIIVKVALCETYAGAWALCHANDSSVVIVSTGELTQVLSPLPIAALNLESMTEATLSTLGIERIGQLLSLPREGLAERFDPALLQRLDQATGRIPEHLHLYRPVPELTAEVAWEYGVADRLLLARAISDLLAEVTPLLSAQRKGITEFTCELHSEGDDPVDVHVRLYQPTANVKHLSELADLQLEKLTLQNTVDKIRLLVCSTSLLSTSQLELFDGDHHVERQRHLAGLADRLVSRLGRNNVLRATLMADAQIDYAYRYQPVTSERKRHKPVAVAVPLQRPLVMYREPIPLEVLGVIPNGPPIRFYWRGELLEIRRHFGPERLAVGWWRGPYIRRDYYRVETNSGNRFWLYRRVDGRWFMQGEFA